jgi:hypothetical protein
MTESTEAATPNPRTQQPYPRRNQHSGTSADPVCARVRSVGRPGLEPGTYGLKVRCSAIELTPPGGPAASRDNCKKVPAFLVSRSARLPVTRGVWGPCPLASVTGAVAPGRGHALPHRCQLRPPPAAGPSTGRS